MGIMSDTKAYLVAGEWKTGDESFEVKSPYDGRLVASVATPTEADVEGAIAGAHQVFDETRRLPVHVRAEALMHISRRLAERTDEVAELIAREGGKPLKWAKVEASRATSTFRWAAEECRRFSGELMRLDTEAALGARLGIVRYFPLGPVLGIAPFNFPVNLVAHKMAPALAVGAPIVIKPATKTPLGALLLGELFLETDLPKQMCSVLPIEGSRASKLATDERFAKITFTGSSAVGWELRKANPKAAVTLELGGNSGVIVHSDADLDTAANRIAFGGYYQAGQSCISVQRVLVEQSVAEAFNRKLVAEVEKLKTGDPMNPETDVGPLINHDALERVAAWVDEAVQAGAEVLCGAKREDPLYMPTVLARTDPSMKVRCEEIFGPVITVGTYTDFGTAIEEVNNSRYGLQAGIFTSNMDLLLTAHRDIRVGGLIANDVSAFRADQMPYGGTKDSGTGREGLRYAMGEMTEPRILVLSNVPL
jgi:acyl-CoA reductase-like NAD-dependent aldehyde dehydrogenase